MRRVGWRVVRIAPERRDEHGGDRYHPDQLR
jgi:hypothetical protein